MSTVQYSGAQGRFSSQERFSYPFFFFFCCCCCSSSHSGTMMKIDPLSISQSSQSVGFVFAPPETWSRYRVCFTYKNTQSVSQMLRRRVQQTLKSCCTMATFPRARLATRSQGSHFSSSFPPRGAKLAEASG